MSLRHLDLKEEYRSDRNNIMSEFFYPCMSNCTEYSRCVDFLSLQSLTAIAMSFANFSSGNAKLRMITGHVFRTRDLDMLEKLFSDKHSRAFDGILIKDTKMQKLQEAVENNRIELKIAIPTSEQVTGSFSERIGIFLDSKGQRVAFTGTSKESFSTSISDFESVDVFTSWSDKTRVETKVNDFEGLWINKTKYVNVYDFMQAYKDNMLKFSTDWVFD